MGEKILYRDEGNYKIKPGASIPRVQEMLRAVNDKLERTDLLSDYATITFYCIWYEATRFLEDAGILPVEPKAPDVTAPARSRWNRALHREK